MNISPIDYFRRIVYSEKYNKFVIIGHARTGSNFLANILRSSNQCRCVGEVFADHRRTHGEGFEQIIHNVYGLKRRALKAVGFKLFYYHLTSNEWNKMAKINNLKIIHLTRENILRTILSLKIALKYNYWYLSKNEHEKKHQKKHVKLEISTLLSEIYQIVEYENYINQRFKNNFIMRISYEKMVTNTNHEMSRIFKELGLENHGSFNINSSRQNPEKLSDLISNYDEVNTLLRCTRYKYLLTE